VGVGISTLVLSGTGLAGFPGRIVDYAGLPLNSAAAIVALLVSGLAIRWAGAARHGSTLTPDLGSDSGTRSAG
jgi:hypothetical protein